LEFIDDKNDMELVKLKDVLVELSRLEDVRDGLREKYNLRGIV
jgi:hypothetical protein